MRTLFLLLNLTGLLLFAGCASTRKTTAHGETEQAHAAAAQARYRAIQAAQKPAPVSADFELLPLARPERTEDGIIRTPSTDYVRVPRMP